MSFSRLPNYDGAIMQPKVGLAVGAGVGMAVVSWLHVSPATMATSTPWLHQGCMAMVGGSSAVVAAIFYAAWLVHLAEACYAIKILASHACWLRASTALPWFGLTCAPRAPLSHRCAPARRHAPLARHARASRPPGASAPCGARAVVAAPPPLLPRFLFGYPQLAGLLRADKERRPQRFPKKR